MTLEAMPWWPLLFEIKGPYYVSFYSLTILFHLPAIYNAWFNFRRLCPLYHSLSFFSLSPHGWRYDFFDFRTPTKWETNQVERRITPRYLTAVDSLGCTYKTQIKTPKPDLHR